MQPKRHHDGVVAAKVALTRKGLITKGTVDARIAKDVGALEALLLEELMQVVCEGSVGQLSMREVRVGRRARKELLKKLICQPLFRHAVSLLHPYIWDRHHSTENRTTVPAPFVRI